MGHYQFHELDVCSAVCTIGHRRHSVQYCAVLGWNTGLVYDWWEIDKNSKRWFDCKLLWHCVNILRFEKYKRRGYRWWSRNNPRNELASDLANWLYLCNHCSMGLRWRVHLHSEDAKSSLRSCSLLLRYTCNNRCFNDDLHWKSHPMVTIENPYIYSKSVYRCTNSMWNQLLFSCFSMHSASKRQSCLLDHSRIYQHSLCVFGGHLYFWRINLQSRAHRHRNHIHHESYSRLW